MCLGRNVRESREARGFKVGAGGSWVQVGLGAGGPQGTPGLLSSSCGRTEIVGAEKPEGRHGVADVRAKRALGVTWPLGASWDLGDSGPWHQKCLLQREICYFFWEQETTERGLSLLVSHGQEGPPCLVALFITCRTSLTSIWLNGLEATVSSKSSAAQPSVTLPSDHNSLSVLSMQAAITSPFGLWTGGSGKEFKLQGENK